MLLGSSIDSDRVAVDKLLSGDPPLLQDEDEWMLNQNLINKKTEAEATRPNLVLVGVMTSRKLLDQRGCVIAKTWAKYAIKVLNTDTQLSGLRLIVKKSFGTVQQKGLPRRFNNPFASFESTPVLLWILIHKRL